MNTELIKKRVYEFKELHGRWPDSLDFIPKNALPSVKYIQRHLGGLVAFKRSIGVPEEHVDHSNGSYRSDKAEKAMIKSKAEEQRLKKILVKAFGLVMVHEQSPYGDNYNMRSDFRIFYEKDGELKSFFIDTFYPTTRNSLTSCINIKLKKFRSLQTESPIFFVNANKELDEIVKVLHKTRRVILPDNISVITEEELQEYISSITGEIIV